MTKDLFIKCLSAYKEEYDILNNFENGLEKLLGKDSTVICSFNDPFYLLICNILKEEGESDNGIDWFFQNIDDIATGTPVYYWCNTDSEDMMDEYEITSFSDYYDSIHNVLKPSRQVPKKDFKNYKVKTVDLSKFF